MKTSFRILMYCADLRRTYEFYSIIGIRWAGSKSLAFDESGLPSHIAQLPEPWSRPGEETGLPDLLGSFDGIEIYFFLKRASSRPCEELSTVLFIKFDSPEIASNAVQKLKSVQLYYPVSGFESEVRNVVADPDGRSIELCDFEMSL